MGASREAGVHCEAHVHERNLRARHWSSLVEVGIEGHDCSVGQLTVDLHSSDLRLKMMCGGTGYRFVNNAIGGERYSLYGG